LSTIDSNGDPIDTGDFTLDSGYFTTGNVTLFTVSPQETGVGLYPVKYDFRVIPNGEVERYGYLKIDLPDDTFILDDNDFETSCGEDVYGFTNTEISCIVTDGGRTILIKDGFLYVASANFTDDDGLYSSPDLGFTLDNFANPREAGFSSTWNVTVMSRMDKELYYWQTADAPTIRVSGVSAPDYIMPSYENKRNGALTWLEFIVTTTGGLSEDDKILIKLPFGWQFSANSTVYGRSNNLSNLMGTITVSVD
jgi:hypothetical protein